MQVPIIKQGSVLIASVQSALSDADLLQLQKELMERVGACRARAIVIDVTVLDVLDSFGTRMLRNIAQSLRLRGAQTVIAGIQPDVAFTMVKLGLNLGDVPTSLDVEEAMHIAYQLTGQGNADARRNTV